MLEKPDLAEELILAAVRSEYRLPAVQAEFLPLGADLNTAVYRVTARDGLAYFLKLRRGAFDAISLEVPQALRSQGVRAVLAPIETQAGHLWTSLDPYTLVLYPFISGKDGYEVRLSSLQWREFGAALRAIHTVDLPPALAGRIPRETYDPTWRQAVCRFQALVRAREFTEPVAQQFAASMLDHEGVIRAMVTRADELGRRLAAGPPGSVLCHSDLHPGNLLISGGETGAGEVYIVDWDAPRLAPKERDLALIGGGYTWKDPREVALFFEGYGPSDINEEAMTYFRYERILEDIAVECAQVLETDAGGEDREQAYRFFTTNFLPDHEVALAFRGDPQAPL